MKLFTTITSERGKPVTKSGNECLNIDVLNEKRESIVKINITAYELGYKVGYHFSNIENGYVNIPNKPKTAREYCFQCSPDGKYTIKGVCKVCEDINKRADKTAREEIAEHNLTLNKETMSYYDESGNEYRREDGTAIFYNEVK